MIGKWVAQDDDEIKVIREWKRDGSTNEMDLQVGAANLQSYCSVLGVRKTSMSTITKRLLAGERFETKHAYFYVGADEKDLEYADLAPQTIAV